MTNEETEIAKFEGMMKTESPKEGPCLRHMMNRKRQMRGRVVDFR